MSGQPTNGAMIQPGPSPTAAQPHMPPVITPADRARLRERATYELRRLQREDVDLILKRLRASLEAVHREEMALALATVERALRVQQEKDFVAVLDYFAGQLETELLKQVGMDPQPGGGHPDATTQQ